MPKAQMTHECGAGKKIYLMVEIIYLSKYVFFFKLFLILI